MKVDAILIGGGVMSATVGLMLKQLEPSRHILMFERLGAVGEESSNGFNNAGTGHAGFMEPNYTKEVVRDGVKTVDDAKVTSVCENFLLSRQYWAHLVKQGLLPDPGSFIRRTDHIALGIGEAQVEFIRMRYEVMKRNPLFKSMEIALDRKTQESWAPLITRGRPESEPVAMTRIRHGTDVDFGVLTKEKVKAFQKLGGDLRLFTTVTDIKKLPDGKWLVTTKQSDAGSGKAQYITGFVFVGAGGWALLMLQKAGLPQVKGYMAFPITGDWAVCQNPEVVARHRVKVYAPGAPGAPPMSMPHLDYRTIHGKEMLLFGPFGSLTPKFLKTGTLVDAICALRPGNIIPTIAMAVQNLDLAVMLFKDVFKTANAKMRDIRHYYPEAEAKDWVLTAAGVRAQIIKKDPKKVGSLQFGTEVVASEDGTIVGLLGASPGASTCVGIALDTIVKCFGKKPIYANWQPKLKEMIPSFGSRVSDRPGEVDNVYNWTGQALNLLA